MEVIYQFEEGSSVGVSLKQAPTQKTKLRGVTYPNQLFNISSELQSLKFTGPTAGAIVLTEGSYTEQQLVNALGPDITYDPISFRYTCTQPGIYNFQTGLALIVGLPTVLTGPHVGSPGSANIDLGINRLRLSGDGLSESISVPYVGRYGDSIYHELSEKSPISIFGGASQLSVSYWVSALGREKQLKFRKNHSIILLFDGNKG